MAEVRLFCQGNQKGESFFALLQVEMEEIRGKILQ